MPVAQKLCWCKHGVFTSRMRVHSLTLLLSKSFAALRKTCRNVYSDKEVPSNTTIHRLLTKFPDRGSVPVSSRRRWTSVVKLFCKFFPTKTKNQLVYLFIFLSPKLAGTTVIIVAF
jgi:hypothetical protein